MIVYPRETPPHTRTARAKPPAVHRCRHSRYYYYYYYYCNIPILPSPSVQVAPNHTHPTMSTYPATGYCEAPMLVTIHSSASVYVYTEPAALPFGLYKRFV